MTTDRFYAAPASYNGTLGFAVYERVPGQPNDRPVPGTWFASFPHADRVAAERNAMLAANLIPA